MAYENEKKIGPWKRVDIRLSKSSLQKVYAGAPQKLCLLWGLASFLLVGSVWEVAAAAKKGNTLTVYQPIKFLKPLPLLFEKGQCTLQVAVFPLDLLDFCLAFCILGLLLLQLANVVLQLVLLEASTLDLVDLLFFFTNIAFQTGHILFFSF